MDQKLQTSLSNFKFDSFIQKSTITVDWFRYDLDKDIEENITGFNPVDLKLFVDYTVAHPVNFGGGKNSLITNDDELPVEDIYDLVPNERINFPEYFILKPHPELAKGGDKYSFMDIKLLDQSGSDNHSYDLPFGVVGRVLQIHN
jgi:hypothetical protein